MGISYDMPVGAGHIQVSGNEIEKTVTIKVSNAVASAGLYISLAEAEALAEAIYEAIRSAEKDPE
jgi:hypothetical protein